jgi:hypothetical protein
MNFDDFLKMDKTEIMLHYCETHPIVWKEMSIKWKGKHAYIDPPPFMLNICMELALEFGEEAEHGYWGRFFLSGYKEDEYGLVEWNERDKNNNDVYIVSFDKREYNKDEIVTVEEIIREYGYCVVWFGLKSAYSRIYTKNTSSRSFGHYTVFLISKIVSGKCDGKTKEELIAENEQLRREIEKIEKARTFTVEIPESWLIEDCARCGKPIEEIKDQIYFLGVIVHPNCKAEMIEELEKSDEWKNHQT